MSLEWQDVSRALGGVKRETHAILTTPSVSSLYVAFNELYNPYNSPTIIPTMHHCGSTEYPQCITDGVYRIPTIHHCSLREIVLMEH